MSLEENKRVVSDFFACFGEGDLERLFSFMADDATWWIGGKPDLFALAGKKSKKEMEDLLPSLLESTKRGLSVTPKGMVAEGNKVAVEAESHGEFINGGVYNNDYHFLLELSDGLIVSIKEYLDTMHTADVLPR